MVAFFLGEELALFFTPFSSLLLLVLPWNGVDEGETTFHVGVFFGPLLFPLLHGGGVQQNAEKSTCGFEADFGGGLATDALLPVASARTVVKEAVCFKRLERRFDTLSAGGNPTRLLIFQVSRNSTVMDGTFAR